MTTTTIQTGPLIDVPQLIDAFKVEIDRRISDPTAPTPDIEDILLLVDRAEKSAASKLPWRRTRAWQELQQAKLALRRALTAEAEQQRRRADATKLDSNDMWQEWHSIHDEIDALQRRQPSINVSDAINWLMWAEKALDKECVDTSRAMFCMMQARVALVYAEECVRWIGWGFFAILIELGYLFLMPVALLLYARYHGYTFDTVVTDSVKLVMTGAVLHIPCYVYVWGFLGGAAWCLNYAAAWSKQRLFDRHYLGWYIANPWISAVLGGAVSLIFLGGLSSMNASGPASPTAAALLSLVSFVAGFSTNSMWKLLDRNVRKLLRDENPVSKKHKAAPDHVIDVIKSA